MKEHPSEEVRLCWQPISVGPLWFAAFLPTGEIPLRSEKRNVVRRAVAEVLEAVRHGRGWSRSVWLLADHLHVDNMIQELSRNAESWSPEMGMGVRPEGPSPRYWTAEALTDRDYGTPLPTLKHTVVGLETDESGAQLACDLLTGYGAVIQTLHPGTTAEVNAAWYRELQPGITEEGLAAYPLYVPLLGLASLGTGLQDRLDPWMGPNTVYLRESAEDQGVLLVSRHNIPGVTTT